MLRRSGAILLLAATLAAAGAASSSAATAAGDFALLHDGSRHGGPVRACVGDRCRVGAEDLQRDAIAWLGLGVATDAAPPAIEGAGDAVVLADGTVVLASIVGVSLGVVVTAEGEHDRAMVRWVRFAPPPGADERGGGGSGGTKEADDRPPVVDHDGDGDGDRDADDDDGDRDDDDGDRDDDGPREQVDPPIDRDDDDDRGQTDPPIDRGDDDPRPPSDPPVAACPADAPLGGHVVENLRSYTSAYDCTGTAELWFDLDPHDSIGAWPHPLYGGYSPSEIVYQLRIHGCNPVRAWDACRAPGMTASGTVRSGGPLNPLGLTFFPLEPSLTFEVLPDEIEDRLITEITCRNGTSNWTLQPSNGIRPHADGAVGTPRVQPTLCFKAANDEARRADCMRHPDRYAVVPFRGVQRSHNVWTSDAFSEVELRWDVCCGCGRPPSGPPPEFDPRGDPCADAESRQLTIFQRMRTARELYEFAERDKVCAEGRRDGAIEGRFGVGGSYAAFFAALGGLASEFQAGRGGDFFGLLFALAAVANDPGRESIDGLALEAATSDTVQDLARDVNVRAAVNEAVAHYARTGDKEAALAGLSRRVGEIFDGFHSAGRVIKVFSIGTAMKSFHEAGWKLCDSWSLEQAWQRELWDAENEMTAADQRWNEADVELQVLRRQCPDLVPPQLPPAQQPPPAACPATPQGQPVAGCGVFTASSAGAASPTAYAMASRPARAPGPRGGLAPSIVLASYSPDSTSSPAAPPSGPADAAAVSAALAEIGEALASAEAGLAKLAPLVLLFSPDLEITVPRPLLGAAAAAAVEVGQAVKADTERAIALAQGLESTLRR